VSQFWSSSAGATPPTEAPPPLPPPPAGSPAPAPRQPARLPPRQPNPAPAGPPPTEPVRTARGSSADARNALLIAAAVVAVLLLFAASFTWVVSRTSDETTAPTTTPPTAPQATAPPSSPPSSPPTSPPTTAPLPPAPTVVIPELQQFVSETRGLPFTADVPIALLSEEDFGPRLLATFPPEALDALLWELQTLGVIGTGPDAMDQLEAMLTENLAGVYQDGQVLVRGEQRSPAVDSTIVHELTHALDDQHFPFVRPELADVQDETPFGLDAVIEGSAMNVEAAWARSEGFEYESPNEAELFEGLVMFPKYVFGEPYVRALLEAGGNPRLDEAFRSPPKTSKEVMESEHHLSGYTPTPVEPPPVPDGAEVVHQGLFGQVRFWQMFTQVLAREDADELASTWTGDWQVVWVDGLDQCRRVDAALETPDAARVFAEALRAWSVSQENAVVEELSSGLVRLTVCAPRPPPPAGSVSPA
jgi:hypothetical protein